jgi:hypothetical protein
LLKLGVFNLIGFSDGGITALRLAARSAGHEAHKDQTELLMLSVNRFLEDR